MAVATSTVTRSFVTVPAGTIHVAQAGSGKPVLLLHQTPRSWDEYRDVVPLLGESFHAIAMDTIGFGDSAARCPGDGDKARGLASGKSRRKRRVCAVAVTECEATYDSAADSKCVHVVVLTGDRGFNLREIAARTLNDI